MVDRLFVHSVTTRRAIRTRAGAVVAAFAGLLVAALPWGASSAQPGGERAPGEPAAAAPPLVVKVMIVNMFGLEARPWIQSLGSVRQILVPGLSADYPQVSCNADVVCQITTGMGHANAAASMMALIYSGRFDLRSTYFVIAGIAGIDPARGTIGSVAWARYAIDLGLAHEIDAREMPRSWQDGYLGIMSDAPGQKPRLEYRTEVFQLDESLLQRSLALSRKVALEDSADAQAYRRHYGSPANRSPQVIQCDTATSDTWWQGRRLGEHARRWTRLLTDGEGVYCTSQQEDNATLAALARGAASGLLDFRRICLMRGGSDFDRPYPHQSAYASLHAQRRLSGGLGAAANNLVSVAQPLVHDIVGRWDRWRDGVPPPTLP